MEVHAHAHIPASREKKWTHYLWEFFMLFLAVFCGFLAENQREHFVEHSREKQFMKSLTEDLETDTAELQRAISRADTVAQYADSVIIHIEAYKSSKQVPLYFANMVGMAGQRQTLINTDRTSSQLKNSGAMRLIRNKKVSDLILKYWKQIDETNISLDRYLLYRNSGREITFKLWLVPEVYKAKKDSVQQLRVIDNDPKKWDELTNLIAMGGTISRLTHITNLRQQLSLAKELIDTIKKEYHLSEGTPLEK